MSMLEKILPYVFTAGALGVCFVAFYALIWDYRFRRSEKKRMGKHV